MADFIELYLIRHGPAAQRGDQWPDDAKRPLTAKGLARMRKEAAALDRLGVSFDQILTSPLVRTKQTAAAMAEGLGGKPTVVVVDALAPDGTPAQVVDELGKHSRSRRLALVGHEPGIGELAARLLAVRGPVEFKKGAICRIDVEILPPTKPGRLRWFATPRMLRQMAK
jgi:phosphohistidine phosphatase